MPRLETARAAALFALLLMPALARAQTDDELRALRSATQVARDGTFLPETLTARVGAQRVAGLGLGGYDTTPGQGAIFSAFAEGALWRRVALRAGVEYLSPTGQVSPQVGLRVGILRQERFGVDVGLAVQYKNRGFSEAKGEVEMMALLGRRWNKLGAFANLVYGQGVDPAERDGEVRLALLYTVHERIQVGVDARARLDLGTATAARMASKLESDFDLLAGPVAMVAAGPLVVLAQAGVHSLIQQEQSHTGFAAMGGVGATY